MPKLVTVTIDGKPISVPENTLVVDAAKKLGISIPVFCYHPKMDPAGMCRMCLVEIGRPLMDRATGQPVLEADGKPRLQFGPKLETSCTTPVSEGMVVISASDKVHTARKDVVEFILTSHPLDCPICDKGGECPLQNLTLRHGAGESRFILDEKSHAAKHVPLGDLIYLDRERCIQCGRCVRFQEQIAGDPVIGFYNRGRQLEIVTFSEPGFDSYFSGNTTDICPVGALTTADFRFGARPWELKPTASICSHCPVGCNLTYDVRREASSGGKIVIKRAMPRQNEAVNEIWICDKSRFAYHYTESKDRLVTPLVRNEDGELAPTTWEVALQYTAETLRDSGKRLLALGSGRLSNEDLFALQQVTKKTGGQAALYTHMAGGEFVACHGLTPGSNLADLGKGALILVVASDLEEEAPIWYLRVKQAVRRGATLIVANARPTKLEGDAAQVIRTNYGSAINLSPIQQAISEAENVVIFYGCDGLGLAGTHTLAQQCADLLATTKHVGRPSNGLIPVWPRANDQGAWELGLRPLPDLAAELNNASALYIVGADPFGDDPSLAALHTSQNTFLVVQDLFLTETARCADVVLPAQAFTEREGSYTSGERRVQRFYPATLPTPECRPDYAISAQIAARIEARANKPADPEQSPVALFKQIAAAIPTFAGLVYRDLADITPQWPPVGTPGPAGRLGLYFSGAAYDNQQGLGKHLALTQELPSTRKREDHRTGLQNAPLPTHPAGLLAVPVNRLYDRGATTWASALLHARIGEPWVGLNPADARSLGLVSGQALQITLAGQTAHAQARIDDTVPVGVALIPRSMGFPVVEPTPVTSIQAR